MTGGYQNWGLGYLSSTELLTVGDSAWQSVGPLPSNLNGLKCITLDNVPYVLGNLVLRLDDSFTGFRRENSGQDGYLEVEWRLSKMGKSC